jgi:hypothetical protein
VGSAIALNDLDLKSTLGLGGEPAIFQLIIWIGLEFEVFTCNPHILKNQTSLRVSKVILYPGGTLQLALDLIGAPDRNRTCNPWIRSPILYPIELRAHCVPLLIVSMTFQKTDPRYTGPSKDPSTLDK